MCRAALPSVATPSAQVRPRPARTRGFTLLELLVVLVIAGIVASVASLALTRNPRTDLLEEGKRLALLFEAAGDEAQVRGHPLAWQPSAGGYRFAEYTRDGWQPLRGDDLFRARRWDVPIGGVAIRYAGADRTAPQLEFGREAIDQAVVVTLSADAGRVDIASTGNGRFTVR